MKKVLFIFSMMLLCFNGFSENSDETLSWDDVSNAIFNNILIEMNENDEYQSFYNILIDKFQDYDFQSLFGENWKNSAEFQFETLEVVFNFRESVVVHSESYSKHLERARLRTLNRLRNLMLYMDKNNRLPNNMFQYLSYRFYVMYDSEKVMRVTYKVNADLHIIDRSIVLLDFFRSE